MEKTLSKIDKAALDFLKPLNLEEIQKVIVKHGIRIFQSQYGSLFLTKKNKLERVYASSPFLYRIRTREKGFIRQAMKKKKLTILPISRIRSIHPLLARKEIKTVIVMPLLFKNTVIGVLTFQSLQDLKVSRQEEKIYKLFVTMASSALVQTQLYERTAKALRSRDEFIAEAAHQLRTPLTTMYGYLQLVERKLPDSSHVREWVKTAIKESARLSNLLNELLDTTKLQAGSLHYSWNVISLQSVIQKAIDNLETLGSGKRVVLEEGLNEKDQIVADPEKLNHALVNIIKNALQFSPESSKVRIKFKRNSQYFHIYVEDSGVGIKKEDIKKILDGMYKTSHNKESGLGLGIFIARNIIIDHQGDLLLNSVYHKGTTVKIKLPHPQLTHVKS